MLNYTIISVLFLLFSGCSSIKVFSNHDTNKNISNNKLLKDTVFSLVSSAENSTLNYKKSYSYIEDIKDGRGYTAGLVGFTSRTGDLLKVVKEYKKLKPNNKLVRFIPALKRVEETSSHKGLGSNFVKVWKQSAHDPKFIEAQDKIVKEMYLNPAVHYAERDNLSPLGQYIYYDALVVHGPGNDKESFGGIRREALKQSKRPKNRIEEKKYLLTFLKVRTKIMKKEVAHSDLSRLNVQRKFINEDKWDLALPLKWTMYGDKYYLTKKYNSDNYSQYNKL